MLTPPPYLDVQFTGVCPPPPWLCYRRHRLCGTCLSDELQQTPPARALLASEPRPWLVQPLQWADGFFAAASGVGICSKGFSLFFRFSLIRWIGKGSQRAAAAAAAVQSLDLGTWQQHVAPFGFGCLQGGLLLLGVLRLLAVFVFCHL